MGSETGMLMRTVLCCQVHFSSCILNCMAFILLAYSNTAGTATTIG